MLGETLVGLTLIAGVLALITGFIAVGSLWTSDNGTRISVGVAAIVLIGLGGLSVVYGVTGRSLDAHTFAAIAIAFSVIAVVTR